MPPPLLQLQPVELFEMTLLRRLRLPLFQMPPPPLPFAIELPFAIVAPDSDTEEPASTMITVVESFPLIVRFAALDH